MRSILLFITSLLLSTSQINSGTIEPKAVEDDLMSPLVDINVFGMGRGSGFLAKFNEELVIMTNSHVCVGSRNNLNRVKGEFAMSFSFSSGLVISNTVDLNKETVVFEQDFCAIRVPKEFDKMANVAYYEVEDMSQSEYLIPVDPRNRKATRIDPYFYKKSVVFNDPYSLQTDMSENYIFYHLCYNGISGAPVLNERGRVVAMSSSCVNSTYTTKAILGVKESLYDRFLEARSLSWLLEYKNEYKN